MNEQDWNPLETRTPADARRLAEAGVRKGDRVRLHPGPRGDIFDLALSGMTARVDAVEQDYEGKLHVAVVVDEDPGSSIGPRRPGHRFFFLPEEVERLGTGEESRPSPSTKRVLVAGIGNIFLGDDGFGVEVAQHLSGVRLPDGVRVVDFGIRGFDLTYALMERHDLTILVDAYPRGEAPGTVSVVEPDLATLDGEPAQAAMVDAHDMNPLKVLRLARSLGAVLENVLVVGCEPATLGPDEGLMGLSEPVRAAVPQAATVIESLVTRFLNGDDNRSPATSR